MPDRQTEALRELIDRAVEHHRAGRLADAERLYRQVLVTDPREFDALHLLGLLCHSRGADEEAESLLERATVANPSASEAFNELGVVRQIRNHIDAARHSFESAIALRPDFAEARNNLALILRVEGNLERSQAEFEAVLALRPDRSDAHANLGVVLQEQGKLQPAIDSYRKAISLKPDLAAPRFNLAQALEAQGSLVQAIAEIEEALRRNPENADALAFLGGMLYVQGKRSEAQECFRRAIALKPGFVQARWSLAMSELAVAYGPGEKPEEARAAFVAALAKLEHWIDEVRPAAAFDGVGSMQPYYLAYHEQDNRSVLSAYGDLCARLMQEWWAAQDLAHPSANHGHKPRVGIVSGKIYDQSVWTAIVKGWCQHLDQGRFELHLLHTGTIVDRETVLAKSLVARFVNGPKSLRQWVDEILRRQFDVLIYPEIGMDRVCVRLASLRLASVQVAAWGHPETTGLPTIDYYLSATDFEPPGAQVYYRERLVPLPGLGCIYEAHRVDVRLPIIDGLGFDPSSVLLLCPGTPYKYGPRHDAVFVEIAKRVRDCHLVFFDDIEPGLSRMLEKRLELAFADAGLVFRDFGVFVPHQDPPGFHGWMERADVCLDTIGFSGFNTAMQAVECGLPLVAYEGRFMRGRFASGILRHLGLPELVATTDEEYVDLVVKLAHDVTYLQRVRAHLSEVGPALFGDLSPIAALETFLDNVARQVV